MTQVVTDETQVVDPLAEPTGPAPAEPAAADTGLESLEDLKARLAAMEAELKNTRKEAASRRIAEREATKATLSVEEQLAAADGVGAAGVERDRRPHTVKQHVPVVAGAGARAARDRCVQEADALDRYVHTSVGSHVDQPIRGCRRS